MDLSRVLQSNLGDTRATGQNRLQGGVSLPDPESAIRRRMRLHPAGTNVSSYPEVEPEVRFEDVMEPRASAVSAEAKDRTPIVSINGEDVDFDDFIHKHCA